MPYIPKLEQQEKEEYIYSYPCPENCQKSSMPKVVIFTRHIWNYGMPNSQRLGDW
jgi:hypothetical protein